MNKAAVRATVRAAREARGLHARAAAADALANQALTLLPDAPAEVSCFLSMAAEPGTGPLIAGLREAGHQVLVPRIRGRELDWVVLQEDGPLAIGPLGIREPLGPAQDPVRLHSLAAMFIPGIAIDRAGRRLGQGGAYYDRVLSRVPSHQDGGPLIVAVLYDEEILDEIPVEPHDCQVDAALTPSGIRRFNRT